jgi:hypothetical protein
MRTRKVIVFITDYFSVMSDSKNILRIKTGTGKGATKGKKKQGMKKNLGGGS